MTEAKKQPEGNSASKPKTKPKAKPKAKKKKTSAWKIAKWVIIPILFIAALVIGLVIGYGYFGDGEASDVFKLETWKHLVDLIFAN